MTQKELTFILEKLNSLKESHDIEQWLSEPSTIRMEFNTRIDQVVKEIEEQFKTAGG